MKVIIQIPCFNEEATLPATLSELPRSLPGADEVEWLIVDDGSTDRTVEVALQHGVNHVVSLPRNRGLAHAFRTGLAACLERGADVIINTDGDNQYCAGDMEKLVAPIFEMRADIVIGCRPISKIAHFSRTKKLLQQLGSAVVRMTSRTDVEDAASGFRAISRQAAFRLNIFGEYTYTLEMLIQAGQLGMTICQVPIRVNGELRPSRLVKSIRSYVFRSMTTICRIFVLYRAFRFFMALGSVPMIAGSALLVRWLYLRLTEVPVIGHSHVPSLVVAAICLLLGFQLWGLALVTDLMAANRKILEEMQYQERRQRLGEQWLKEKAAAARWER
jgi:glycosyltransferase involved in cell wall biosynthesis